jgi:RimJ/RimL family protein N-acetyltransferase
MKLETERLILREPRMSDWKDMVEGLNDLNISKYLLKVSYPYKEKDAKNWIKECIKKSKDKEKYHLSIELKSEKKIIGGISLEIDKHNKIGKTGSWINRKYQRKGYITEAKIAINNFAFNKLNLRKLETSVFRFNKASNTTQKKVGYISEGRKRKHAICKATGKIHDENMYGLMKENWKKILPKLKKHLKNKIKKLEKLK